MEPRYLAMLAIMTGDHFAKQEKLSPINRSLYDQGADLPAAIAIKAQAFCEQSPSISAMASFLAAYNFERNYQGLAMVSFK